jgi:hypothetical protein
MNRADPLTLHFPNPFNIPLQDRLLFAHAASSNPYVENKILLHDGTRIFLSYYAAFMKTINRGG